MLVEKRIPGDGERERLLRAEEIHTLPPVMLCLSIALVPRWWQDPRKESLHGTSGQASISVEFCIQLTSQGATKGDSQPRRTVQEGAVQLDWQNQYLANEAEEVWAMGSNSFRDRQVKSWGLLTFVCTRALATNQTRPVHLSFFQWTWVLTITRH